MKNYDIPSAWHLMVEYKNHQPGGHFFDASALRWFGERLSDMRVLRNMEDKMDHDGVIHTCYVLSSRQRNAPGGPRRVYHYFDRWTFEPVGCSMA